MRRTSSYPTEDGLDFTGIDFPTPVSQIDRLERQNQNLVINVFGWENGQVVVHRISEKGGEIPRINLMLTKQGENTHYSLVKRLSALLFDQSKNSNSKHFCERCLHGYSRWDLLERHKPECKARADEKPHKNGYAETRRKQDVFHKLPQADESALCGLCRL